MSMINSEFAASLKKRNRSGIDFSKILNPEQYEACVTTEGAVLIAAGAGTGKTNTLVKRVMYLVGEKGIDPERILLLTFTNRAAKEMLSRARQALDERCGRVKGCTYHSFCAEWLRKYSHLIGIDNGFVIYDTSDCADTFNLIKENLGISREEKLPGGKELAEILSASINKKKDIYYLFTNNYPEYQGKEADVLKIIEAYKQYKKEKNIMDYDDLIVMMNFLLRKNPDIARNISDTYQYVMVDEYQDSNLIQLEMLTLIRQFDNKNICVVGDDFQSIYGFRGANFRNIMDFPKQFEPCKVITLFRNYRSNQEILDLSNAVMRNAREKYDKNLVGLSSAGHKPCLVRIDSADDEAELICHTVRNYHEHGVSYRDIAVIVHSSNTSSLLEMLFMKPGKDGKKIPYKKFGGIRFMERRFVKDIFAILKIIINKRDEISWFRVLQFLPGIGAAGARKVILDLQNGGYAQALKNHEKKKYHENLGKLFEFFDRIDSRDFHEQLSYIIDEFYPRLVTEGIMAKKIPEADMQAYIQELKEQMEQAQVLIDIAAGYKTASEFVTEMILESPDMQDDKDYVTITTVHSVKGMEFKVVMVMDCTDGSFPWRRKPKADTPEAIQEIRDQLEEERRVFYVAITRAKNDLYLFAPDVCRVHGNYQRVRLSPYLDNCMECCDVEDYRS